MKRTSLTIWIAIAMFTFGAIALQQPAMLSGTAMGVFVLCYWPQHHRPKAQTRPTPSPVSPPVAAVPEPPKPPAAQVVEAAARIYIDEPNIFSSAYIQNLSVRYEQLGSALTKQGYHIEQTLLYVMEKPASYGYRYFVNKMEKAGIKVIKRSARKRGNDVIRKDIDTWLATDVALDAADLNTVILVTGDNDFSYTVKRLQERHKHVVVLGLAASTSQELQQTADRWINLEDLEDVCLRKVRPPKKVPKLPQAG